MKKLAFKGGTCLRKMILGSHGRFSTDLDFTSLEEHEHEDILLDMMKGFEKPFHGIQFQIPDNSYYETQDGLSWGVNPTYSHSWNASGASEIKLQISRREPPTLPTEKRRQCEQSYFEFLPFVPSEIVCLALPEMIAEKIRACYQRNKARDIYDLSIFSARPLNHALIRRLVVLKLWQARDHFNPQQLMKKFEDGSSFDWNDLAQLVRRTQTIDGQKIAKDCLNGLRFLAEFTDDERVLANDPHQRERVLWKKLCTNLPAVTMTPI
ncbi:MAG: nucleotidyl transferase AbiEii/AbiGii toxin family protein [Deltaproteobacteria bacterium]|nr:nucleotidyl transferase AbiEii/AbiGii toxin family protein [Deltaproteobacteria bacterium]